MAASARGTRFLRSISALLVLLPLLSLGCTLRQFPQSSLHPQADYASQIQRLLEDLMFWVVVIFVLVEGALVVAVVRFRNRPGLPEPKMTHGHTGLEIGWTIAPAVILAFIAVPTVVTIFKTQSKQPAGALEVKVVGHQWWWEFQYPGLDITTASELHVPIGQPVAISLQTADVIHSFWFPAMGGKRDVIPTHTNAMWFTPEKIGTFPGQCAEFCGVSHANMGMRVIVDAPEAFARWVAAQKTELAEPAGLAAEGKAIFAGRACVGCHTIRGVSSGALGPDLTTFGSRHTLAAGLLPISVDNVVAWLKNPPAVKPDAKMPALGLTDEQARAVATYLIGLK